MGERKGTNHYYPPDYDPKKGGLNKFLGTHALRERARKLHLGILIIRFEMPYNIWCDGCDNHIGMGVRYNAEKTKVDMYYSTPVYKFRMKCHLCDNHFEIKTDPANFDYIILSGARRQENRWDPTENEQVVPTDSNTGRKLVDDAMFKLEHTTNDKNSSKPVKDALVSLIDRNDAVWKDNFEANAALRKRFRAKKKELQCQEERKSVLLKKSSLSIPLLPEHPDDVKMATLLTIKSTKENSQAQKKQAEINNGIGLIFDTQSSKKRNGDEERKTLGINVKKIKTENETKKCISDQNSRLDQNTNCELSDQNQISEPSGTAVASSCEQQRRNDMVECGQCQLAENNTTKDKLRTFLCDYSSTDSSD